MKRFVFGVGLFSAGLALGFGLAFLMGPRRLGHSTSLPSPGREPFVTLAASADEVSLKAVVGTNRCQIGFAIDSELPDRLSVVASIDNLVKGAAGQAIQNLNLMMGWEETSGLLAARAFHP